MFILGFGIGFGMQILTLVVQNEFPHAMVGAATAAYNFFSEIGSVLGASLIGTLFTSRLTAALSATLPATDNISVAHITPVSYTHLDVYKRQRSAPLESE